MFVKTDVKLLIDWFKKNKNKYHTIAMIAFFHHKFENIHPFSDGNGRTGRILLNHILMSYNYPPLLISRRFRKRYLDVMNEADKSLKKGILNIEYQHYKNLIDFIIDQYNLAYWDLFLV